MQAWKRGHTSPTDEMTEQYFPQKVSKKRSCHIWENPTRAKVSDGTHRRDLTGSVGQRRPFCFSQAGSLFPIFSQQQSVIQFMIASLLCYDNLMRYLVAKETKASPEGGQQGSKTAFEEKNRRLYIHQVDRNMTRNRH